MGGGGGALVVGIGSIHLLFLFFCPLCGNGRKDE